MKKSRKKLGYVRGKFGKINLKKKEEILRTIPCSEKKEVGKRSKKKTIKHGILMQKLYGEAKRKTQLIWIKL